MKTIWKFKIEPITQIDVPGGDYEILDIQVQGNVPCVWILLDPDKPKTSKITLKCYGTGHTIPEDPGMYIGTFQLDHGSLVFHVFKG